jgi:ferredoxin
LTEKSGRCKALRIRILYSSTPKSEMWKGDTMARTVVIDEEACTGCGTCAAIAEDCFALNEDTEKAQVTSQACSEELFQEAIDTCPEEAISWKD